MYTTYISCLEYQMPTGSYVQSWSQVGGVFWGDMVETLDDKTSLAKLGH